MKFTKMHGCGNDYIFVDCTETMLPDPSDAAKKLSMRNFGVGGDGLILICPSQVADFRMAMYNADGSEGAMCGNGIRCLGKYVYDKGLTDKEHITVETKSGVKALDLTVHNGKVVTVRVDMGMPNCNAAAVPVTGLGDYVVGKTVQVADKNWTMTCISMGNPHAVVWVNNVEEVDVDLIGPQFEHHPMFPDRVNVEFVEILGQGELNMRVWERGSGETMACGTGACASVAAAYLNHKVGSQVLVHVRGGDLSIELGDDSHIYLTGPATTVFEGEISYGKA